MNRRNFIVGLIATVIAVVVLARERLRQIASQCFYSIVALSPKRVRLIVRQKRMNAATEDLRAIVNAEIGYIRKHGRFATLDELISNRDLGPEMAGRHGYVYNIRLEGKSVISASAYPVPGEQLGAIYIDSTGPGLAPVLARLSKETPGNC
jgi:hypothetical protein